MSVLLFLRRGRILRRQTRRTATLGDRQTVPSLVLRSLRLGFTAHDDATASGVHEGVLRAQVLGIKAREFVALTEEAHADEQLHHRVGEQEDHGNVDDSRDAQGKREALNATHGEQIEHDGGDQVDRIGDQNRALGAIPALLDGGAQSRTSSRTRSK